MGLRSPLIFSALMLFAVAHAQIGTVSYLGVQTFATGSTTVGGARVGGLSGIDYDAATGTYYLQSDARTTTDTGPFGRYFTARIDTLATTGTFGDGSVAFTGVGTIKQPDGTPFPATRIDPESIRFRNGKLYVSSEGEASTVANQQNPFVRQYDAATGTQTKDYAVPSRYNADASPNATTGIRNNLAFESLTFSADGLSLYTATENALKQDGPAATATNGSNSRILQFDATTGQAMREFVYRTDPIAVAPTGGAFAVSGLVELLSVDATHMLALERSFTVGVGNSVKMYEIDFSGATDVSAIDSVSDLTGISAVSKRLVFDFGSVFAPSALDNLEGIAFGPTLPDGSRSLIVVSDDNFGGGVGTQFIALKVQAVPEPASLAVLALGAVGPLRRRRA